MAQSKNNIVTHGMSGMIEDILVFRQVGGKTIVGKAPKDHGDKPASNAQQAVRSRFQQAVIYGKAVISNPSSKAPYEAEAEEGQSAYNIAVADFFNAPDIEEVDLSNYTGAPGGTIRIKATDDFAVTEVLVRIENPDGTMVEEDSAAPQPGTSYYLFTTGTTNTSLPGDKIIITAIDRAGNHTVETRTL